MQIKTLLVKLKANNLLIALIAIGILLGLVYTPLQDLARPPQNIVSDMHYLIDEREQLDQTSVSALPHNMWQQTTVKTASFGMSDKPYWFRFTLPANQSESQLLVVEYPLLDHVSLWFQTPDGAVTEYLTGDSFEFAQRPLNYENFVFPVPDIHQPLTVYMRVQSSGAVRVPVTLWNELDYLAFANQHNIIMGLFLGFLLAMAMTNLFCFVTTRKLTFAVYCGYVVSLGLTIATLNGLGYQYLWPQSPWFEHHAFAIFTNFTGAFSIIFCDLLLNVKQHSARLSYLLKLISGFYLISVVASLFAPMSLLVSVFLVMLLLSWALIYGVGIWLWIKGQSIAGVYTVAWSVLFLSGFVFCLDNLNLVKLNVPSDYLLALAATIEALLLALVLAINHNRQRLALEEMQKQLLAQTTLEKEEQTELLALHENAKEDLEYKVQERTLELEIALRELSDINRELQERNTIDALTGVRNRSYFEKKYIAEIRRSRREQTHLSIVMIDIDHFKTINDKFGHLVGDDCIKSVALSIKNSLKRPSDDLCRYGGEEFVLILPSTELAGAHALVEQLRQKIEQSPIMSDGFSINLTISAGIATAIADPSQDENMILAAADQQLYLAKNSGRNTVKSILLAENNHATQD